MSAITFKAKVANFRRDSFEAELDLCIAGKDNVQVKDDFVSIDIFVVHLDAGHSWWYLAQNHFLKLKASQVVVV